MKFKMLIVGLLLSGVASAQSSVSLSYGLKNLNPTNEQKHVSTLSAKTRVSQSFDANVSLQSDAADVSNKITTRTEAGVTYLQPINNTFSAEVKTLVGLKQKSGEKAFTTWSVEPALKVQLTHNFDTTLAYRYRTAFSRVNEDESDNYKVALGYKLTKVDKFELSYDKTKGDGACDIKTLKYTRSF